MSSNDGDVSAEGRRSPSKILLEFETLLWKTENHVGVRDARRKNASESSDDDTTDSREKMSDEFGSNEVSQNSQNVDRKSRSTNVIKDHLSNTDIKMMLNEIFDSIAHSQASKAISETTLARLLKLVGVLILRSPKALYLSKLFRLCNMGAQMTFLVARCLRSIFEGSHFEPGETLMFPQRALSANEVDVNSLLLLQFEDRAAGSFVLDRGGLQVFMASGMTVSTWIKLVSSEFKGKQHVLSIGCKELKVMAEICPFSQILRISIITNGALILKNSFPNILKLNGEWVNLVLGIQYNNDEFRAFIMVGNHHRVVIRQHRLNIRNDSNVQVSVGSRSPTDGVERCIYRISTVFAFKGLLPSEYGVVLRSLGSACFSLTECRLSQIYSSLLHCLGKPIITSKHCNAASVCSESDKFLNKLQRLLLFTWRPCSAHCYSLNILQKNVDYVSLMDSNDSALCLTMSKDLPVYWFSAIVQERCETLDKSLRTIGSIKIFLFIYALSVDMGAPIETQAETFHLLFVCLKRDPSYFQVFNEVGGASILVRILSSRQAHMNLQMCQDILLYSITKLEFRGDGELYPSPRTSIVEPEFLRTMLSSADIWKGGRFQYWARILFVISESISETTPEPFRSFNNSRLVQVQFLHQLLLALLDMEMYQSRALFQSGTVQEKVLKRDTSLPSKISPSMGASSSSLRIPAILRCLITELIGRPFRCDEVTQLWNFILLSHPAHDTYFDYSTRSHNEWISEEYLGAGEEPEVTGPFELSKFFEDLLNEYGTGGIKKLWVESGNNVINVRNSLLKDVLRDMDVTSKKRSDRFRFCRMNSVDNPPTKPICSLDQLIRQKSTETRSSVSDVEHWLVEARAELLDLMSNVVLMCEDSLMDILEADVIYWQTILVLLSNQKSSKIRTFTFNLLKNFFLRCSTQHRYKFVTKQGFLLLSNELKKSTVNSSIADALFSLTCGEHVVIRDGLDSAHLEKIIYSPFKIASFYALYALLEESIYDSALFWSVCSTLQKMFMADNAPRRAMFDSGLVSTMINVLWKLCFSEKCPPVDSPMFSLIDCWISFAQSIIAFTIPYKNSENYLGCEDFVWLCIIAAFQSDVLLNSPENLDISNLSNMARIERGFEINVNKNLQITERSQMEVGVKAMRKALCQIIYCWIDTIQSILTDQFQPSSKRGNVRNTSFSSSAEDSDFELLMEEDQENPWSSYYNNYSNKLKPKEFASLEDMAGRVMFGMNMAQNFFFFLTPPQKCSDQEETLFRYHIDIVLATWKRKQSEKLNDEWQSVLIICRDKARNLLAELIAFVLYPAQAKMVEFSHNFQVLEDNTETGKNCEAEADEPHLENDDGTMQELLPWALKRRLIIVRYLAKETFYDRYYMEKLLDVNLDYQYAMEIALHELALLPNIVRKYSFDEYSAEIERLVKFLARIQIESPLGKLTKEEITSLSSDEVLLIHSYFYAKKEFCNQIAAKAFMICETDNALNKITTDTAMTLTCEIAEFQNVPRKLFIQWRKSLMNDLAKAGNKLENFIRELCHPQAAFFDRCAWPVGRTLETTESSCRERRRLTPCHYQFPLKFLRKDFRTLAEESNCARLPLWNILQNLKDHKSLDHAEAITQVRLSISATLLRTAFECYGEIVVADRKIYFLGEQAKSTQKGVSYAPVTYSFAFEQVREIQIRAYLLKDTALELFTTTGDAFLIIFSTTEERNILINQLQQMGLSQLFVDHKSQLSAATEKWRKGVITNFEYLMILNKLSGRSFNDLMQYPVFPFILSNYSQKMLDLSNSTSFRDLSRPMAIQDTKMESVYVQNYNNLLEEFKKVDEDPFSSVKFGAYHYGSHYSNTGIVAYYLVRVPPYTSVALEYQDNNFDIADRLFNSLETTWRLSSSESTTDFKELIPEFFFFPEMFQNQEHLALGVRQAGQLVENVLLPPWCPRGDGGASDEGDPRLFCFIHRQALESATVTSNLHLWIDLIFGYKQNGDSAVKAINVFHPATYRGRDLEGESVNDELSLSAVRTMVRTYGQMPLTLFPSPHLPRLNNRKGSISGNLSNLSILSSSSEANEEFSSRIFPNHVFRTVEGLRWGEFYGSPEVNAKHYQSANFMFKTDRNERINKLTLVYDKDGVQNFYGVPIATELITYYKSDRRDVLRRNFELMVSATISWRFSDNVLRIKLVQKNESQWINLVDMQSLELTNVAFSPSNELLYVGFKCGLIRVYSLHYKKSESVLSHRKWSIKLCSELFAHEFAITSMQVSDEFHVLISTSVDGKICLWDTNRLEFISTFIPPSSSKSVDEVVTLSCISQTSADVCVCLQSGHSSRVVLFTINGKVVGVHEESETVTSMAMTNVPEGTGINCLAIGLVSGVIRLLDMWTMNVLRDFSFAGYLGPITSLLYTNESRRLFAAISGYQVLCLQLPSISNGPSKTPSFNVLNPFS